MCNNNLRHERSDKRSNKKAIRTVDYRVFLRQQGRCGCLLNAVAASIIFDDAPLLYSYGNSVCFNPTKRLSPTNSFILRLQLIHGMCDCMSTAHATKTILRTSRPRPEPQWLTFNLLIDGQVRDYEFWN